MDYIRILQYEDACKRFENNSFAGVHLDPKVRSAVAYAIKDDGFIRQRVIGGLSEGRTLGAQEKNNTQIFVYAD
jgi:hypothetical protein